ncbi:hypothetical protein PybrP1_004779, partial [[Pythium] brassicae (nom. inval.)]
MATSSSNSTYLPIENLIAACREGDEAQTALFKAAENGFTDIVRWLLLECGADVNAGHKSGATP